MNTPEPARVLDYIEAFRRSKAMFTAVQLGIFDELEGAPQSAAALASRLGLHQGALTRLLDAGVALGLLERDDAGYRNSALASRYLISASADTFAGYIRYSNQSLFSLWSHLEDAIREGTNRWTQTFGSRDALFDYYFRDPAATAAFMSAMNGFGRLSSPWVVRGFNLGGFQQLVDLGGATGHLAIAACETYPELRATVFDLPSIEELARKHIAQSPVAARVEFVAGDFFQDALPPGDLYALGRILHDWTDEKIGRLLGRILATLPSGGGLLVAEALLNDDHGGPLSSSMQDLNMLVCTEGRERSEAEYRELLEGSGFVNIKAFRTGSPLDALLARKA